MRGRSEMTGAEGGRVIVRLCSGNPSQPALDAALRIARAFHAELEALYVEDAGVLEIAKFSFSRELSFSGRQTRNLSTKDLERDMRLTAAGLRRRMQRLASRAGVTLRFDVVRDEPVNAVATACATTDGPRNFVALGETFRAGDGPQLHRLFEAISQTSWLVLTGPQARRSSGPIVIVAEDVQRLPDMMRMAARLSAAAGDIILLMIGEDDHGLQELEGQARLALGADIANLRLAIAEITRGEPKVLAESLRRLHSGFVIGRYGGLLVPPEGDIKDLIGALECPLLLVP